MIPHDVACFLEPKKRYGCENLTFLRNGLLHDDVESRDAVGRNHEERRAEVIHIAYFAAPEELEVGEVCLNHGKDERLYGFAVKWRRIYGCKYKVYFTCDSKNISIFIGNSKNEISFHSEYFTCDIKNISIILET